MQHHSGHGYMGPVATIDLAALTANYYQLLSLLNGADCAAVVKTNAYGLGVEPVAEALQAAGCKSFFVATLEGGIRLRQIVPTAMIGVFHGPASDEEAREMLGYHLTPVLNEMGQVKRWEVLAAQHGHAHASMLHIDTGISRLGLTIKEAKHLAEDKKTLKTLRVEYVMSHLACAGAKEHPLNAIQLQRFNEVRGWFPHAKASFSNSSGIFMGQEYHMDMARPGGALYGLNPTPETSNPIRQVFTLEAPILQVRVLEEAETVGYGGTYSAPKGARLATLAVGYADGLPRALSNVGVVHIGGKPAPIVGIISMDLTVIDISAFPEGAVNAGDWVELCGPSQDVDSVSTKAGSVGYEFLTRLGARVHRQYVGENVIKTSLSREKNRL